MARVTTMTQETLGPPCWLQAIVLPSASVSAGADGRDRFGEGFWRGSMDDGDGQWAASTCEEALAFIVAGLKPGRSAAAVRPRRGSSITVLMLGGSAIAILMFFCLMMGSLFAEGATGVFIFLMWDAFVLAYLSPYLLRTQLRPVAGEGSEGSVRMLATRRGIEATTFMVMPWPR